MWEARSLLRTKIGGTPGSPLPPPGPSGWKFSRAFTVINFSMKNSRKNPGFPVERAALNDASRRKVEATQHFVLLRPLYPLPPPPARREVKVHNRLQ